MKAKIKRDWCNVCMDERTDWCSVGCEPDHQLHKANRLAHEVARAALAYRQSNHYPEVRRNLWWAARKYEKAMEDIDD